MMEEELFAILKESYDVDITLINAKTELKEVLDSIDFLGLLLDVRKKYQVEIDSANIKDLQTVEQIAELIRKNQA